MRKWTAKDYRVMPWKNGGGSTTELAIFPETAGMDHFVWRLSTATVAQDGAFSHFTQIDRSLAVLTGTGLVLKTDAGTTAEKMVTLTQESLPHRFPGEDNIFADFAYVIPLTETTKLSFGVKGGVTLFNTNFNGFVYTSPFLDPAFENNISEVFPNIGAGTYLFGNNYYLGFSTPNLLTTKHLERQSTIVTTGVEAIHYFLTGGYVFTFNNNDNFKVKPAFMAKGVSGAPVSIDLTTNVLINNKFEAGVGYRIDDSFSALASFYVTPTLRIGYSYDYTLSSLKNFNSGSHEVFVLFDIDLGKLSGKGYDKSPRFF